MELSQLSRMLFIAKSVGLHPASGGLTDGAALPALSALTKTVETPKETRSILITHVLRTAVAYVDIVNSVYPIAAVVAIPYSADTRAVKALRDRGYEVVLPKDVPDTFTQSEATVLKALESSAQPLVVQEVGGYLARSSAKLAAFKHFRGVVEDTNNGHWLYERTAPHPCPVLSMARSPLKDVEDTVIGDAVLFSIERVIRENFSSILQGCRSAVIGFGKIGTSTATALKGRESVVSIYDINPGKNMRANAEGFNPVPLHLLLPRVDLVVGCTGQTSVRRVDMDFLKDGCILASASSKDIEFDLKGFAANCKVETFDEITKRYVTPAGKAFYVLLDGTPINFRDGSMLGTILDMIYSELFVCMRLVANGLAPVDLSNSPPEVQNEVAKAWLRAHSKEFEQAGNDKVWDYPESLKLGLPQA
ncbi:NAD(P)-dependent oxidoreductase [Roseomonas gilardii]|uniref:NAD(P)-dependent oxidoreductase n=1 Tax=Roseomonas gilardii TaxID=257708 RepID=UPI0011A0AC37|nr:NAD(P)-dependent oxidoreductase [Roseomonas gilardii]